jgi:hypothetical protein
LLGLFDILTLNFEKVTNGTCQYGRRKTIIGSSAEKLKNVEE